MPIKRYVGAGGGVQRPLLIAAGTGQQVLHPVRAVMARGLRKQVRMRVMVPAGASGCRVICLFHKLA
jgi:hypothetical protein